MTGLYNKLTGWLAAAGIAIALLAAAYARGSQAAAARQAAASLNEIKKARKVEDEINRLDNDAVRSRLDGWMREKR